MGPQSLSSIEFWIHTLPPIKSVPQGSTGLLEYLSNPFIHSCYDGPAVEKDPTILQSTGRSIPHIGSELQACHLAHIHQSPSTIVYESSTCSSCEGTPAAEEYVMALSHHSYLGGNMIIVPEIIVSSAMELLHTESATSSDSGLNYRSIFSQTGYDKQLTVPQQQDTEIWSPKPYLKPRSRPTFESSAPVAEIRNIIMWSGDTMDIADAVRVWKMLREARRLERHCGTVPAVIVLDIIKENSQYEAGTLEQDNQHEDPPNTQVSNRRSNSPVAGQQTTLYALNNEEQALSPETTPVTVDHTVPEDLSYHQASDTVAMQSMDIHGPQPTVPGLTQNGGLDESVGVASLVAAPPDLPQINKPDAVLLQRKAKRYSLPELYTNGMSIGQHPLMVHPLTLPPPTFKCGMGFQLPPDSGDHSALLNNDQSTSSEYQNLQSARQGRDPARFNPTYQVFAIAKHAYDRPNTIRSSLTRAEQALFVDFATISPTDSSKFMGRLCEVCIPMQAHISTQDQSQQLEQCNEHISNAVHERDENEGFGATIFNGFMRAFAHCLGARK